MRQSLVTISILGYNDRGTIGAAIRSAALQRYPEIELVVVDNASPDGASGFRREALARAAAERRGILGFGLESRFVQNRENAGFARGHNAVIARSRGEFVLLLNSDAILEEYFVARAVEQFSRDEKIGALQGKVIRYDFSANAPVSQVLGEISHPVIDTTGLVVFKNRRIVNRGQGEADRGQFAALEEIFGADGATPVYRRQALEDVKVCLAGRCEYFDEDFFSYKEDVDLAWRLRLYGWKTLYVPGMLAWHARGSGESAATSWRRIIEERRRIKSLPKLWSFKNQRLMQLKNELVTLVLAHFPRILFKEIGAWLYLVVFERRTLRVLRELIRQAPSAFRKRRIIMARRRVGYGELVKWFR